MDQKLVKININIGSRSYPLKVTAQEAETARAIEQQVNATIRDIQTKYPTMDAVDYLSMSIIKLAFDSSQHSDTSVLDQIQALQAMLVKTDT